MYLSHAHTSALYKYALNRSDLISVGVLHSRREEQFACNMTYPQHGQSAAVGGALKTGCKIPQAQASKPQRSSMLQVACVILLILVVLVDELQAGDKGRDIIIKNGHVILRGSKKKGNNIIISHGHHGHHGGYYGGQGKYKYKKKYMNYGGWWRKK